MNHFIRAAIFACMLFSTSPVASDSQSEIREVVDYFAQVWNEGDLDSIQSHYHADFVLVTSTEVLTKAQRLDDLGVIMAPGKDHGRMSFSNINVKPLGANHAMVYGRSRLVFKDDTELGSNFSTVYLKTPFGWKAILTHE